MMGKQKIVLDNGSSFEIDPEAANAAGGEGKVYFFGDIVVKIYTDPQKMMKENIVEKIKFLKTISHPYIIQPQGIVFDRGGKPIGFYMAKAQGEHLTNLITEASRNAAGFESKQVLQFVARMREVMQHLHGKSIIMCDPNEYGWFVHKGPDGFEPRAIDIDAVQVGTWKGKAVMESIEDPHEKPFTFTEKTDWFSLAVVTFYLLTGVHPYAGRLKGYKPNEMKRRKKDNKSVLTSGVGLPPNVRKFEDVMPPHLLAWYADVFQNSKREAMPDPLVAPKPAGPVVKTLPEGTLEHSLLYDGPKDPAVRVFPCGVVLTRLGQLFDLASNRVIGTQKSRECEVIASGRGWLIADVTKKGEKTLAWVDSQSLKESALTIPDGTQKIFRSQDRMFAVHGSGLTELNLTQISVNGSNPLKCGPSWVVAPFATVWLDGSVGIQNVMGKKHLVLPVDGKIARVEVPELNAGAPVAARVGNRYVAVLAQTAKGFRILETWLNADLKGSRNTKVIAVDGMGIGSITVQPTGLVLRVEQDGVLVSFAPNTGDRTLFTDRRMTKDLVLGVWGEKLVYVTPDGSVWWATIKKKS